MAKLMAELYYFMAIEMIDKLGEEKGIDAIRESITKFGKARIEAIKEEALKKILN